MKTIDIEAVNKIIASLRISKGLRKRLSVSSLGGAPETPWTNYELTKLPTKDGAAGVLIIGVQDSLYATPYELGPVGDKSTGRVKPIICDFCKTWQAGGRAGSITFRTKHHSLNSISFLCCLDLKCSLHVRDMTEAAKLSRAQLREDVSQEYRTERLRDGLSGLVQRLKLKPIIANHRDTTK